jgi:hypothetical protein
VVDNCSACPMEQQSVPVQLAGIVGKLRDEHVGEMFHSVDVVAIGCDELNVVAFECFP